MKIYAGVGSRSVPENVCKSVISPLALFLKSEGWKLRSGHALGCDLAFETGADDPESEIFLPWKSYNIEIPVLGKRVLVHSSERLEKLASIHPVWDRLGDGVRKLMIRTTANIAGEKDGEEVSFVLCWTENGEIKGGTGHGINIASGLGIPVINLFGKNLAQAISEIKGLPCFQSSPSPVH